MSRYTGKYHIQKTDAHKHLPFLLIPVSFFLIELFGFCFLMPEGEEATYPLLFGLLWSGAASGALLLLPALAARIAFGILYFFSAVYAGFQTGYYLLFSEMMWLSDFRYAAEGSDYADMLLTYPLAWWLGIFGMIALGILILWLFPRWKRSGLKFALSVLVIAVSAFQMNSLPELLFEDDEKIKYAGSDYGRSQSAQAVYENMFNTHRLYRLCGLHHTLAKDLYQNTIYPLTPSHAQEQEQAESVIRAYFSGREAPHPNAMTGVLKGKNVVLVLMESMDDWMIGQHTPTIQKLMEEGINFTNFYTPVYGGIRTFNTEFAINTGSFLSSKGGYAFDYVTNSYPQSLANRLREAGYSAKTFHYNDPTFYSRGEFSPAMGYEEYVCYADYVTETDEKTRKNLLYDDLLLFENEGLKAEFFREGQPTLNFVITRSAHLSYKYNEVLSYWGLKKYPEYRGLTGNEETDCAYLKARLVDDFFAGLLRELEAEGQLNHTVIIGVTDHYTYGYKDLDALYALSGTKENLLLEKTPCFIWSSGLESMDVDKLLNTSDLLPTMLNLLGIESSYEYIGQDAFAEGYAGFVPFSNGSWIVGDTAYDSGKKQYLSLSGTQQKITAEFQKEMANTVQEFITINNLILESDYYQEKNPGIF
ncbi:MAG: LTA synthase family protein [Oscillospiraceae bacterium]|nr:LTA synthase family protein [Oscillospiraceae bacterium]